MWDNKIIINSRSYDVRVVAGSLQRTATVVEGRNSGTSLRYRKIRDIQGTKYTYAFQVEPNPTNPTAYDEFYEAITNPIDSMILVVPYGQSTIQFEAYVENVSDSLKYQLGGYNRWTGCKVTFVSIAPVRLP